MRNPFHRPSKFFLVAILATLTLASFTQAEEKSLWQKFKDFFSPVPTVVGEGPEYDELRELDQEINKLEGKYSRERRVNNKQIIRKKLDELKAKREDLAKKIEEKEKQSSSSISAPPVSSSSEKATNKEQAPSSAKSICTSDTVFVHDTITVHDTLYVIVAGKPSATDQPKKESETQTANDSTGNPPPALEPSVDSSAESSASVNSTVPDNK